MSGLSEMAALAPQIVVSVVIVALVLVLVRELRKGGQEQLATDLSGIRRDISELSTRMAKLEGFLSAGNNKSNHDAN